MKALKQGGHRLFETDPEISRYVGEMLLDLEKNGMDAVRRYSRQFDDWDPADFELSEKQIAEAVSRCSDQLIEDTDFCQGNVRAFAEAQLKTLQPLEVEIRPGIVLGHKHIPVSSVGSYIPGGRSDRKSYNLSWAGEPPEFTTAGRLRPLRPMPSAVWTRSR